MIFFSMTLNWSLMKINLNYFQPRGTQFTSQRDDSFLITTSLLKAKERITEKDSPSFLSPSSDPGRMFTPRLPLSFFLFLSFSPSSSLSHSKRYSLKRQSQERFPSNFLAIEFYGKVQEGKDVTLRTVPMNGAETSAAGNPNSHSPKTFLYLLSSLSHSLRSWQDSNVVRT